MIQYSRTGTVRLYWDMNDSRRFGLLVNTAEPPNRDPEENAYLSGMSTLGVPKDAVGVYTFDLTNDSEVEVVDRIITAINEEYKYFAFVKMDKEGNYDGFFISTEKPDMFATFNLERLEWELPENIGELKLAFASENKKQEIRAAALERGTAGAKIIGSVEPHLAYRMALTPDDVTYLQLANTVARMEAEVTGTHYADATAEIKEKWLEDGACRTKLHTAVPLPVHDAVLLQAVLQAAEISRHLEELIQSVNDAATAEDVEAVSW